MLSAVHPPGIGAWQVSMLWEALCMDSPERGAILCGHTSAKQCHCRSASLHSTRRCPSSCTGVGTCHVTSSSALVHSSYHHVMKHFLSCSAQANIC